MTRSSLLKRLYLIAIIAAPLVWLILTDEGHRFTDITLLKLKGGESMDIHLQALDSSFSEQGLRDQLPDIPFNCGRQNTALGERICQVQLASLNGLPARFAIAYFRDNRMQGFKVGYQRPYHETLIKQLFAELGEPGGHITATGAPGLYRWVVGDGELMLLDEHSLEGNEPALLWRRQQPDAASDRVQE